MKDLLNSPLFVAGALVVLALAWQLLRRRMAAVLTPALYDFICVLVEEAVNYAEQTYKETEGSVNRVGLAIDHIYTALQKANIMPERYLDLIKQLIKAAVLRLPKTHDEEGNIVI